MTPVTGSRTIHGIGWDDNTLYVHFYKSGHYKYENVTLCEKEDIMKSDSPGQTLHRLLRNRIYKRINESDNDFKRLKYS